MSYLNRKLPTILLVLLMTIYGLTLWLTAPSMGYTRDEGYYFKAAEQYMGWWYVLFSNSFWKAFDDQEILKHLSYNTEHPPLVKFSIGWTYVFFHKFLGICGPAQGFRAAGMLWAVLSIWATFGLGRRLCNAWVGLMAAASLVVLPRYFFDAHLACFDVAITAMWTLSLWAFVESYLAPTDKQLNRCILSSIVFGLALATKLNAFFLPFVFVAIWLMTSPTSILPKLIKTPAGGIQLQLPLIPMALWMPAIVGPVVFFAVWPYLWHQPWKRFTDYIVFHLTHEHYPISYFHELLTAPPFPMHFPFVMTLVTVPAPLLILGFLGLCYCLYLTVRKATVFSVAVVAATMLPICVIAMPNSPIFGGVKHWYNAMPTWSIAAAFVLYKGFAVLPRSWPKQYLQPALVLLFLLPGLLGISQTHPNGIGYYNAIAGGYVGAARLGMQRGFWGGLAFPIFDRIRDLPSGTSVFFNRTNFDSFNMYKRQELIPSHIHYANEVKYGSAGIHFEQPEHGQAEADLWSYISRKPVAGVYQDNVCLAQFYVRGRLYQLKGFK